MKLLFLRLNQFADQAGISLKFFCEITYGCFFLHVKKVLLFVGMFCFFILK